MNKTYTHALLSCLIVCFTNCNDSPKDADSQSLSNGLSQLETVLKLDPDSDNPRNSEGDFIRLNDGRILFVYTHFTTGDGDHASAFLAGRFSSDDGKTWTEQDVQIISNESGLNVMSANLLRLDNGNIALFYLKKESLTDCRPILRISQDEAKTWSEPLECIKDNVGYYVLNNDRVIQLNSGRLIVPVSRHATPDTEWSNTGTISVYYSDDYGQSWQQSIEVSNPDSAMLQEPGVVALSDGRIMMFLRTDSGVQYLSYSADNGKSWSPAEASNIRSPRSPASIERIPSTGHLLMAWNNNGGDIPSIAGKRTPFNVAISKDEGKSWQLNKTLFEDPDGWYCYTAIDFVGEHVLLGHSAGNRQENNGLAVTHVSRLPLDWVYSVQN